MKICISKNLETTECRVSWSLLQDWRYKGTFRKCSKWWVMETWGVKDWIQEQYNPASVLQFQFASNTMQCLERSDATSPLCMCFAFECFLQRFLYLVEMVWQKYIQIFNHVSPKVLHCFPYSGLFTKSCQETSKEAFKAQQTSSRVISGFVALNFYTNGEKN